MIKHNHDDRRRLFSAPVFTSNHDRNDDDVKILLVNDDGVDAPGLEALAESVRYCGRRFGNAIDVTVVAPDCGRSECGHGVTNGRPLTVRQDDRGWYGLDGTPVDCVRVALGELCRDVDCVISGINAGANLGVDLLVSGTFAAAREAAIHGVPALAVSHYRRPDVPKTWDHTPRWLEEVLSLFFSQLAPPTRAATTLPGGKSSHTHRPGLSSVAVHLWNVNLPAIDPEHPGPPLVECIVDPSPVPRVYSRDQGTLVAQTDFHNRPRIPGSDVTECFAGAVTLSKLRVNPW